jgi:hypothetical protein
MKLSKENTEEVAALKSGMSLRTARNYLNGGKHLKETKQRTRTWETRKNPFEFAWPEIIELITKDDGLQAKTIFQHIRTKYPETFKDSQLRTLQRRIKEWKVLNGLKAKPVMFLQDIKPGLQSQSDYTYCNGLKVTIKGKVFNHLLYHFMLPYSRWEHVEICHSESFKTLSTNYTKAVVKLGAIAPEHRTDNLGAAVVIGSNKIFQKSWLKFLAYYTVKPSSNNPYCSNENGSVEKSNDIFKNALDQRLRLRGSREFNSTEEYELFLQQFTQELNNKRLDKFNEELRYLKPLAVEPFRDTKTYTPRVLPWSTITIDAEIYSVPSNYIGQKLRVVADCKTLAVYYGKTFITQINRTKVKGISINYQHVIADLLKKPGAFENYKYKDFMFPRSIFRITYDKLVEINSSKASKEYLQILHLAFLTNEDKVAKILTSLIDSNIKPNAAYIKAEIEQVQKTQQLVDLKKYDKLLPLHCKQAV